MYSNTKWNLWHNQKPIKRYLIESIGQIIPRLWIELRHFIRYFQIKHIIKEPSFSTEPVFFPLQSSSPSLIDLEISLLHNISYHHLLLQHELHYQSTHLLLQTQPRIDQDEKQGWYRYDSIRKGEINSMAFTRLWTNVPFMCRNWAHFPRKINHKSLKCGTSFSNPQSNNDFWSWKEF